MKKKVYLVLSTILLLLLSLILIDRIVYKGGVGLIFDNMEDLGEAQAVLVLGARVYEDGRLSVIFRDRVDTALEVYNSGKAGKILVSGDHGREDYDEVNAARDYLLEKGISEDDIFTDHAGFSTYDSIYRARDVFLADSIIISTQEFHLPRALYIAEKLGVKAQGIKADKHIYFYDKRNRAREAPARIKAFFNVALKTKPKFLGETISISGSGRDSWD
jgi:SanA protein